MAVRTFPLPESGPPTGSAPAKLRVADTRTELPVGAPGDIAYAIDKKASYFSDGTKNKRGGEVEFKAIQKSANYTMANDDSMVVADATGASFTVTLPSAAQTEIGAVHIVKKDSSLNSITVARQGSDTIEGATSKVLVSQFGRLSLVSDGDATWYVLGGLAL